MDFLHSTPAFIKKAALLLALSFSLFTNAQDAVAPAIDRVSFSLDTNTEHIEIPLPEKALVQEGSRVVIDGRTYSVQTLNGSDFPVNPKYDRDKAMAEYKDLMRLSAVLACFKTAGQEEPKTPENTSSNCSQWVKMPDGEFIMTWHAYKKIAPAEQTLKFSIAKVTGQSILLFTLEDYIDWRSADFETTRTAMYKVLDDAIYIPKAASQQPRNK